jgi:hypothetical protein
MHLAHYESRAFRALGEVGVLDYKQNHDNKAKESKIYLPYRQFPMLIAEKLMYLE